MANDDYFKIMYVILTELYEHMKEGTKTPLADISSERFKITDTYLAAILCELLDKGYVKGFVYRKTKTGRVLAGLEDIEITMDGLEYLQENSKMKKVGNALKEIRDWVPGL